MERAARIRDLVAELDTLVPDSRQGLPDELFYLVSRLTPLVNVDLLIRDDRGAILLTWRDDRFYQGWHVPGGIIRFKETADDRIRAVGLTELGAAVEADATPCAVNEKRNASRDVRGHFISLLYATRLLGSPDPARACHDVDRPEPGQWAWHLSCPDRFLPNHAVYRPLFRS